MATVGAGLLGGALSVPVLSLMQEPGAQTVARDVAGQFEGQVQERCGFGFAQPLTKNAIHPESNEITARIRMTLDAQTDKEEACLQKVLASPMLNALESDGCALEITQPGTGWTTVQGGVRVDAIVDCLLRDSR